MDYFNFYSKLIKEYIYSDDNKQIYNNYIENIKNEIPITFEKLIISCGNKFSSCIEDIKLYISSICKIESQLKYMV